MLLETITSNDVQIGLHAKDWEGAIRQAAAPLLASGAIQQSYIEGMITSVHDNGPYFVLSKGLALAHARPEDVYKRQGESDSLLTKIFSIYIIKMKIVPRRKGICSIKFAAD